MLDKTALYTSNNDIWETPQALFDELNEEFNFTLDACADENNHKVKQYFDTESDGLEQDWAGHTVWCNPPYSQVATWAAKCHDEGCKPNTTVVMLVPSRTDTKWFQNYCYHRAEIRFVKGRLRFGSSSQNAPFPSMLVIFRGAVC